MKCVKLIIFIAVTGALGTYCFLVSWFKPVVRTRLGSQAVHLWSKVVVKIFRLDITEKWDEPFAKGSKRRAPRVIVANHLSYIDIPILASRGPCLFLAKKEVASWPILGRIAQAAGTVFVDRRSLASRANVLLTLSDRLAEGFDVVIFPEGSTSVIGPQKGSNHFYAGAFRLARMQEAEMELVFIEYANPEAVAWLGDAEFLPHLWNFLGNPGEKVRLRNHHLKTIVTRGDQRRSWSFSRHWILESGRQLMYFWS